MNKQLIANNIRRYLWEGRGGAFSWRVFFSNHATVVWVLFYQLGITSSRTRDTLKNPCYRRPQNRIEVHSSHITHGLNASQSDNKYFTKYKPWRQWKECETEGAYRAGHEYKYKYYNSELLANYVPTERIDNNSNTMKSRKSWNTSTTTTWIHASDLPCERDKKRRPQKNNYL